MEGGIKATEYMMKTEIFGIKRRVNSRWLCIQRLINSACLVMIMSYAFPEQNKTLETLTIGIPYGFYTIYMKDNYPRHFDIGNYLLDIVFVYFAYVIIYTVGCKMKHVFVERRQKDEKKY